MKTTKEQFDEASQKIEQILQDINKSPTLSLNESILTKIRNSSCYTSFLLLAQYKVLTDEDFDACRVCLLERMSSLRDDPRDYQ